MWTSFVAECNQVMHFLVFIYFTGNYLFFCCYVPLFQKTEH